MDYDLGLEEGRDFRVKRGHWLPRTAGVECIALGRTLYHAREDGRVPRHEYLHLAQFARHGVPRVAWHYLFHVTRNWVRCRDLGRSFREVPFEVEARLYHAGGHDAGTVVAPGPAGVGAPAEKRRSTAGGRSNAE